MRRNVLTPSFLAALAFVGCSSPGGPDAIDGQVGQTRDPIAFGSQDGSNHSAVVALLADAGGGAYTECSGSIVQVKNGKAYVLTAAHCCNQGAPSLVVVSYDYKAGELVISGQQSIAPPVYAVDASSVYYDSAYNQYDHDFCMLKFSAPSSATTLKLPTSCSDGVANGVQVEHVGFGITNKSQSNTLRWTGTDSITSFNGTTISYNEGSSNPGGNTGIAGPCEGDSGGPALIPAGAAQSQQTVVATTSFGQTTTCGALDTGTSSRTCSEIGANGFITKFLADTPIGTPAGSTSTGNCQTCEQTQLSQGGACASTYSACVNTPACNTLLGCLNNCQPNDQTCADNCWNAAGTSGQNAYNNIANCICNTGCPTECSVECGGSTSSSSSSSSSGSSGCGLQANDPTCNSCLTGSCCAQASACFNNATCLSCVTSTNPPSSCNTNAQFTSFVQCLQGNCASPCGLSSSSSSSSGSTTTSSSGGFSSSSSGGNTSTSSSGSASGGMGGAGAGGGGTGANGNTGGGDVGQKSGCSVGATGAGADPSEGAGLAGLLLGLGIAARRRRRSA